MRPNKNNQLNQVCLKPGAVINILNISEGTLRYWREHLDPRVDKRLFSGRDLLMYSVLNLMIRAEQIRVGDLEVHNWKQIFEFCSNSPMKILMKCAVVFDAYTKSLFISKNEDEIDLEDNWLHCVKFRIAKKQIDRHLFHRAQDNIIYIDSIFKQN